MHANLVLVPSFRYICWQKSQLQILQPHLTSSLQASNVISDEISYHASEHSVSNKIKQKEKSLAVSLFLIQLQPGLILSVLPMMVFSSYVTTISLSEGKSFCAIKADKKSALLVASLIPEEILQV